MLTETAKILLAAGLALILAGCALGAGASAGLTVDTRGAVGVMVTANALPWGFRNANDDTQRQGAGFLMPVSVGGGYEFNPSAAILRVDLPAAGFSMDEVSEDWGIQGTLNPRAQFAWPTGDDPVREAWGVAGGFTWLQYLHKEKIPKLSSRPEWPQGWKIHSMGPTVNIAVMNDDKGWFGQLFLGASYSYLTYFMIGL